MPLMFSVDADDLTPAAEVWARCSHHEWQPLAAWAMNSRLHMWVRNSTGWRSEYVGDYIPTEEERADTEGRTGRAFQYAVARPKPGQPGHWRDILTCPRPTCNYRQPVESNGNAKIKTLLEAMVAADSRHMVIEVNDFLKDPGKVYRRVASATE